MFTGLTLAKVLNSFRMIPVTTEYPILIHFEEILASRFDQNSANETDIFFIVFKFFNRVVFLYQMTLILIRKIISSWLLGIS